MENINTSTASAAGSSPMSTTESSRGTMVTGLFRDRESAERGYQALSAKGYEASDMNVVMSDATRKKYFEGGATTELGNKAVKGAGMGGAIGGTLGAVAAAIAAIGTSLVIPGLGLIVAGPLAAGLAGAGAGGAAGGIVGALIGAGIPEERVKHYDEGIRNGGILMGVKPRSAEDGNHFQTEWKKAGAEHVFA